MGEKHKGEATRTTEETHATIYLDTTDGTYGVLEVKANSRYAAAHATKKSKDWKEEYEPLYTYREPLASSLIECFKEHGGKVGHVKISGDGTVEVYMKVATFQEPE